MRGVCGLVILKKKETRQARGPTPPLWPPVGQYEETILKGEVVAVPDGAVGSLGRRNRRLRDSLVSQSAGEHEVAQRRTTFA